MISDVHEEPHYVHEEPHYVYEEPDENGANVVVRVTRAEAIRRSRAAATKHNYVYPEGDAGDEMAIEDFLVVHWAWEES
jgi:hypothetical protein